MRSRLGVAIVVASLVVLAGCGTFVGGSSEQEPAETMTPVPVMTPTSPTPTPVGDPPPGVSANGTIDIERLVSAHESSVADRSYSWRFSYTARQPNGTKTDEFRRRVRVGDGRVLVDQATPGLSRNQSLYIGDSSLLRTVRAGETEFEQVVEPWDHHAYAFAGDVIERYLTDVAVEVSVVNRDGRTYYRLYSDGFDVSAPLRQFGSDFWNYTLTAYVTQQGFVRTVAVDYRRDGAGGERRITTRYDYSGVGSTTVSEPPWVSRQATTVSAEIPTRNGTDSPGKTTRTPSAPEPTPTARGMNHRPAGSASQSTCCQSVPDRPHEVVRSYR
jgi:hypothetical protein